MWIITIKIIIYTNRDLHKNSDYYRQKVAVISTQLNQAEEICETEYLKEDFWNLDNSQMVLLVSTKLRESFILKKIISRQSSIRTIRLHGVTDAIIKRTI